MGRFLSYGHGVSVPLLGLDFSYVPELLALAIVHHFNVTTAVGANEYTATIRDESVTIRIGYEFKGLVAAGGASVTVEGAACCVASGVVGHHSTSFSQNSLRHSAQSLRSQSMSRYSLLTVQGDTDITLFPSRYTSGHCSINTLCRVLSGCAADHSSTICICCSGDNQFSIANLQLLLAPRVCAGQPKQETLVLHILFRCLIKVTASITFSPLLFLLLNRVRVNQRICTAHILRLVFLSENSQHSKCSG